MRAITLATIVCATTASASPEMTVTFRDGAPKDRIAFTNTGTCDLGAFDVTLDLAGSPFDLIFDVTSGGAGVEVFQPVEIVSGAEFVTSFIPVEDGATTLNFQLGVLPQDASITFTVDLDDTVGTREITVSGAEIQGASVRIDLAGEDHLFDESGRAIVPSAACAASS